MAEAPGTGLAKVHDLKRDKPWARLPGEPAAAYDAFLDYLKQDPANRNFEAVFRHHKASWRTKERWQWAKRAEAFDGGLSERKLEALETQRAEAATRQATIGRDMQQLASDRLKAFAEHGGRISAMEAAKIAEIGARLERLALGEPTENVMQTKQTIEAFVLQVEQRPATDITD